MSSPSFVNTDKAYQQLLGVVDVQAIMDAIATMVTATLTTATTGVFTSTQRWSIPSANVYQSPADARGRYMKVTLARTSATRMGFKIADPGASLFDGEIQISAGGSTVNIFAGPGHLFVEANNADAWEAARAFISDPTPEALDSSPIYVWGITHRDTSANPLSNGLNPSYWGGRYLDGGLIGATTTTLLGGRPSMNSTDNSNTKLMTEAGSDCAFPMSICPPNSTGTDRLNAGKLYQLACVDSNQVAGTVLQIPVDIGLVGNFQVLNLSKLDMYRLALRKP